MNIELVAACTGNALLVESDKNAKLSDLSTWRATFEKVVSRHYPNFLGRYTMKLVSCPAIHSDALNMLARFVVVYDSLAVGCYCICYGQVCSLI